jgi:UDP-N-acetylmuramate dehydrogenase
MPAIKLHIEENKPLREYSTFKVGGAAEFFTSVESEDELKEAVAFAKENSLEVKVLGGGSNVLIEDEGVSGFVVHMKLMGRSFEVNGNQVLLTVQAGEVLDDVVAYTVEEGWWGIENLSHIPGSVGATPIQNVGAYGVEAKDVIASVRVFNTVTGEFESLSNEQCMFGYRDSIFKSQEGKKYIVTAVTYALSLTPDPQISYRDLQLAFLDSTPTQLAIREEVVKIRAGKFPDWNAVGTAGSFFKNPIITQAEYDRLHALHPEVPAFKTEDGSVKISLGWILDKALNLRGHKKDLVSTYKNQALVVIAEEGATANDIKNFAQEIVQKIKKEIGIDVEWEVSVMK